MKLIRGAGIKDVSDVKGCPYYVKWKNMIDRVYGPSTARNKTYSDHSICQEWLTFSNFKAWMETQDWEGKDLDKDWIIRGCEVYSPETCIFVSPEHNKLLTGSYSKRGDYPIGVSYRQKTPSMKNELKKPYRSSIRIDSKFVSLGSFETPEAAHKAWQVAKAQVINAEAQKIDVDSRLKSAMIARCDVLYTDLSNSKETKFL